VKTHLHKPDRPVDAIARALENLRNRDRRATADLPQTVQVLHRPQYPRHEGDRPSRGKEPRLELQPEPEPIPEPEPPKPALPAANQKALNQSKCSDAVSWLNVYCQKVRCAVPSFEFEPIVNGFRCSVVLHGRGGIGEAANKKEAKRLACEKLMEGF
jgi:hypothetical protein